MKYHRFPLSIMAALASISTMPASAQHIAVPSYIYPGAAWAKIDVGAPTVGIAIINPGSGPGTSPDPLYQRQVREARAHGLRVLGYVATTYGNKDPHKVEAEIDDYYRWYAVDGIFLDEGANTPDKLPYYKAIHDYIRKANPSSIIVLNPGTQTDEGYLDVADILLTFEGSYDDYIDKYHAPAWVDRYPSHRFYHVIYGAPTASDMENAVRLSRDRNAGWVYVTSEIMPNPYGALPPDGYWKGELTAVRVAQ